MVKSWVGKIMGKNCLGRAASLIFIFDFFEGRIAQGYDRECHIRKSTEINSIHNKNPPCA
jgi:hypothetical protein